jgi:hypothetical protein
MFGSYYYGEYLRKVVIGFGTLFNNIYVETPDNGVNKQVRVPLTYAPKEKFIRRLLEESSISTDTKVGIRLPQLSFAISQVAVDSSRRRNKVNREIYGVDGFLGKQTFVEVPININFNLFMYTRHINNTLQITEQIIPYFNPEFNIKINFGNNRDDITIPLVMINGININEKYDGNFGDRRINISSIGFVAKAYMFSPAQPVSLIPIVENFDLDVDVDVDVFPEPPPSQSFPNPPSGLSVLSFTGTGATLGWTDDAGSFGEDGFKIYYYEAGSVPPVVSDFLLISGNTYVLGATAPALEGIGNVSQFIGSLNQGETYSFVVTSYIDAGSSGYAGPVSIFTPGPPATPTALFVSSFTGTGATLGWVDQASVPTETQFKIYYYETGSVPPVSSDFLLISGNTYVLGATYPAQAGTGSVTGFIGNLNDGETYSFVVTSFNAVGSSGYAGPVSIFTPGPPDTPTGLRIVSFTGTGATLAWIDSESAPIETEFVIYVYNHLY